MKIDIHTHTRKCKSGDAHTREISAEDFCEQILATDVRIVAITNHNAFDFDQYEEIREGLDGEAQVWPGIELDVVKGESRGHLLVIVSPNAASDFAEAAASLTKGTTPDNFTTTIDDVVNHFDALEPLYIGHYGGKKPDLSDEDLEELSTKAHNADCVIKEVTNSISAGIYISHGRASIYGSDVHDWGKYEELAKGLPDLRLPVDGFEHFCLLLKKDPTTINTVLDRKTSEELLLDPFDGSSFIRINPYDDINIVFGSKGTGKTRILEAIAKHYSDNGIDASVYESASGRLDEIFDIRGRDLKLNLATYDINYCADEIEALRDAHEVDVTSLSKYVAHFAAKKTSRNAKKILLKDIEPEEVGGAKRKFSRVYDAANKTEEFLTFLSENASIKDELSDEEFTELTGILESLLERLEHREWNNFSDWKQISLLNSAIEKFQTEVGRKTGTPPKPISTGFRSYAMNRIYIERNATEIIDNIETDIPLQTENVGSLGSNKGDLEFRTEFKFQSGSLTSGALSSITGVRKTPQKEFVRSVRAILAHAYSENLFQHVSELNSVDDVENIATVYELLLFQRYFALNDRQYAPSSGEASMVMLHKELGEDKDIYILDEPERSLGNEYINDVIVPLIKERARSGKKVFISTHDANIAVRTLPYSSIYRCHDRSGYRTYIGNPFSNNLVNPENAEDQLDWKKVSMRTLEGGEEAFGERGKIYGNN